ncbi:GNAT family N-acetyltransferase [Salinibacterium sp. ZJ450]|uniref:GNAT family N-acetyltransferase n=1 Tax=Salinibacterium sp. ZJ450 TaxID=2708338 RepID=UPI0014246514|nr:GNAT family N-acetyltransferase [Salinibacterium sp. ZJ450]
MHPQVQVRELTADDASVGAPLFALYREFYGQPYDEGVAERFLRARLDGAQSVVLIAELDGDPVGLIQLYPGFSSIAAAPSWHLNDLYVLDSARGHGVATALMAEAERLARSAGAVELVLETAHTNTVAQRLYEREGYRRDAEYITYEKPLT